MLDQQRGQSRRERIASEEETTQKAEVENIYP